MVSRWSRTLWRLSVFGALASTSAIVPDRTHPQEPRALDESPADADSLRRQRIRQRRVRITRAPTGEIRVVELLQVARPSAISDSAVDLRLIQVQAEAGGVRGLGGDVNPERVVHTPPHVAVLGPLPGREFQLAFEYRFSADVPTLTLAAEMPVDELLLFIDRAGIDARVDTAMVFAGEEGSRAQPIASYRASDLGSGEVVEVKLETARIGWRERVAVLAAACLAAGIAALLVVRREGRERLPPSS